MAAPTCTTADVAELILERVGSTGADFTASTTPTVTQVSDLITKVAGEVIARVGADVPALLASYSSLVVATGTAMRVELAFTNDLARDQDSKYNELRLLYYGDGKTAGMLETLADAVTQLEDGGDTGAGDQAYGEFPLTTATDAFGIPVSTLTEGF